MQFCEIDAIRRFIAWIYFGLYCGYFWIDFIIKSIFGRWFFFPLWFYLAQCKISGDLFFVRWVRLVELLDLWNVWIRCTLIIKNEICLPDQKLVDCKFQCRRRFIIITQALLSINITFVVVAVSMPAIACNVTERIWMNFDYLHRM